MTLGELLQYLESHPFSLIFYFGAIPLGALLSNLLGKGEGHINPWCSFYALLIYLSVIPGVFAVLLLLYHILFGNTGLYEINLLTHILPVASMLLSLYIIKQNVSFDKIPGFDRITGFAGWMGAIMILFFFLDKARLFVFTYVPFIIVVIMLVGIYLLVRYGTQYLFKK